MDEIYPQRGPQAGPHIDPRTRPQVDPQVDTDRDAAERDHRRFVERHLRRNYAANFLHGMLGQTGFRLIYSPTFIPAYIHALTRSDALVGAGTALLSLGAVLSPIVSASRMEHQPRILPYAMRTGLAMRTMILALALSGWLLRGWVELAATLACLFLLGVFNGTQRVAFQLLMGKVIPIDRRGRLQAWRNFAGGIVAAALAYAAGRWLIERNALGNGYATTFFLAFVLTSLGLIALRTLLNEPDPPVLRAQMRFVQRIREFPALFADRDYRWFLIAEAFCVCARIASPFYILFAGQRLGLSGVIIGSLALCYLGADTISNLVWGHLGDRFGYRVTFIGATLLWIASILLLLFEPARWGAFAAFVGLGAAAAGYMMSQQTMVLEFGRREDVAMRLAFSTTVDGTISAIGPLVGGIIATTLGYPSLFLASAGFLAVSLLVLLFKVREPRRLRA